MIDIDSAVQILRRGGLVAFPTETVYGLGADATNSSAIEKIFRVKGRPSTNPLICHVANESIARRYARTWPLTASRIGEAFWPGPITIVVAKAQAIVDAVTAGKQTVGLRVPNHPLTLELLKKFDGPLAGPSANRSTYVSPTIARHVQDELGDAIDLILDGGPCSVGIESTVLDLSGDIPAILRPGGISKEQIESVIGPVRSNNMVTEVTTPAKSPGQHAIHYAPTTLTYRFDTRDREKLDMTDAAIVELTLDPETYARNLYARLRLLDTQSLRAIYVEMPPDLPEWTAVRDRLLRATRPLP
ncbi:MAG TPA: L-threonylcarbamoyladenylate synthase [Tepidisphaeraceae bacterium]|jgi:L-threonylcarbamoyladenylate synthase|nr:L-threonylcarbamoyladenylate synthase [Tepidisphaeraceae bacterium]